MTTAFPCKTARPCLFGWSWKMAVPSVVRDKNSVLYKYFGARYMGRWLFKMIEMDKMH